VVIESHSCLRLEQWQNYKAKGKERVQVKDQIFEQTAFQGAPQTNGRKQHNLQLLLANLQNGSQKLREGSAIVFASASAGDGASHVAKLFAIELARHTSRRTLVIDSERLQNLGVEDYLQMPWNCHPTNIDNLWMLPSQKSGKNGKSECGQDTARRSFLMRVGKPGEEIDTGLDAVEALKVSFDNILIDCRSLKSSTDAAVLANSVDGVVVVVDAGESRNDEILNAQRTIESAGGKFLGFVLNKRRYPVPEWLYKRL
jgi:protein-tyrosine kinase